MSRTLKLITGTIVGLILGSVAWNYLYSHDYLTLSVVTSSISPVDMLVIPIVMLSVAAVLLALWQKTKPFLWSVLAGIAVGYLGFQFVILGLMLLYVHEFLGLP